MPSQPTFEQIVRDHEAMVFRTLARLVGRQHGVDDLAQDVFLRLFRALPGFRHQATISTYLYRIVVNVAQEEWKRRAAYRSHISLSDQATGWAERLEHPARNAEQDLSDRQFQLHVDEQLMRLSEVERAVLVLYHQEARTYEQIALALGLPIGTVRTHLHRGRRKLREAIAKERTLT